MEMSINKNKEEYVDFKEKMALKEKFKASRLDRGSTKLHYMQITRRI